MRSMTPFGSILSSGQGFAMKHVARSACPGKDETLHPTISAALCAKKLNASFVRHPDHLPKGPTDS